MTEDFFAASQGYKRRIESGEGEVLGNLNRYSYFIFEHIDALRESIRLDEKNAPYYRQCYADALTNNTPLDFLGSGTRSIHYRLGQLESGLFLALRTIKDRDGNYPSIGDFNRKHLEKYAQECEKYANSGRLTSPFIVGARIHLSEALAKMIHAPLVYTYYPNHDDLYFLIVQDFTDGGSNGRFIPADSGLKSGEYKGRDIYYDFDDFCPFDCEEDQHKFMSEDAMVHIHLK